MKVQSNDGYQILKKEQLEIFVETKFTGKCCKNPVLIFIDEGR
jgi:hypothetical protein